MRLAISLACVMACTSARSSTLPADAGHQVVEAAAPIAAPVATTTGEALELVHYVGRFDLRDPRAAAFAYPGSALVATFEGTGISADIETNGADVFSVEIDDRPPARLKPSAGRAVRSLAKDLAPGRHKLTLTKRTETFVGLVRFRGFTVDGGALVPSPFPFSRRIELIGDSITCGYGDEGREPCPFSPDTENETIAWGAIAARELGAAHTAIAYSGKGVWRNSDGTREYTATALFQRTIATRPQPAWDFTRYTPDAVILNLGTNDYAYGDPGKDFEDAYVALLALVRETYPNAWIVCALGTMMFDYQLATARPHLTNILERFGDARSSLLDMGVQDADQGCNGHPNRRTHEKMGRALAAHLREKLGW